MGMFEGGVAAYRDCAAICDALLKRGFPAAPGISDRDREMAEMAMRTVLEQLATSFRAKARNLEILASEGGSA
jgi:hypothetical protein